MKPKVLGAFNEQINAEMYSAYLYYAMAQYFEDISLSGFAAWMKTQAQEEMEHAVKFVEYVNERDGRVKLKAIEEPQYEWESPLAAFEAVLEHEKKVTALINDLVALAMEEKDNASYSFLQWFVNEQVEEEATARGIIDDLKLVGDDKSGLFMINRELGQRQPAAIGGGTEE